MTTSRTALVTGGNRGIGLEVCRQLATLGCRVILAARDVSKGQAAAASLTSNGDVVAAELDVTDPASIRAIAREPVDVLVNNAGILLDDDIDLLDLPADKLRATFETNLFAPIAVAQAFVPGMMKRGYGRIVNVSSQAGQLSSMNSYAPAYSMSKAALNAFTRQLAAATKGTGVLVNSACPGWVRTDMGGRNAPRSLEEGADTIVWLATLPPSGPTGGFFSDRKQIAW
jgi:NAD(P)-dependent dehydrogenase (short-subunit alcohol dehydrogenase family)